MTVGSQRLDESMRRATLLMVMLNSISTAMMLSAVNVALPDVARDLAIDAVLLSWIPMSYLMASAAFVLAFGRLADMFGRKRVYLIGTAGVIVTSALAACASTGYELIAGRLLQGVCAAMLYATNVAIVSSVFPPEKRGAAIGYTISTIYLGLALGPVLGGWLIELFNWRVTFLVHIPITCIVLFIGCTRLPIEWNADDPGDFDALGAGLYGLAIIIFMMGVAGLPRTPSMIMILIGMLGFWLFFRHERHHSHPVFDVELFYTNRVFTMSCLAALVMYTTTFANLVLISLYLQYLKGMTPSATGMLMMAQPLMMAVVAPISGKLSDRFEPRVIASSGMLVAAIGLGLFSSLEQSSSIAAVVVCLLVTGLGFSLFTSPNTNAVMGSVDSGDYGRAAGALAVMRVVGQMSSMGLVALVFALALGPIQITPAVYDTLGRAISTCFTAGATLCALGMILSFSRGRVHVRG